MSTKAETWQALQDALKTNTPGCDGLDEFTRDDLDEHEIVWAASVCNDCPVFDECNAYAAAARPASGYWAGRQRTGRR